MVNGTCFFSMTCKLLMEKAGISPGKGNYMDKALMLLNNLYSQNSLSKQETVYLLENMTGNVEEKLFEYSDITRKKYFGNRIFMRGLVEFSNICRQDCLYCGIRCSNKNADRYRLSLDEIIECCKTGYQLGYRTFVLQSGEDSWYTLEKLSCLLKSIKHKFPDAAVTLSIGEKTKDEYRTLFYSGADRYLLRHETASKKLYSKLHPSMDYNNRIKCLYNLKEIGYQVGAGFMVGLPGQTGSELAEDLLFLKKLNPHMIGIGPFFPHSRTPLKNESGGSLEDTLKMIALTRLFIPDSLLPATTAIGTLHPKGRELALKAGANVVMPNISPVDTRVKYELYENKICTADRASHCRKCIENRINHAGFEIDMGRGDSPRKEKRAAAPF